MDYAESHILPKWWPCDLSPSQVETWQEDDKWFAKFVYQGESDGFKFRLLIPKVFLGHFKLYDLYTVQTSKNALYGFADFGSCESETYIDDHGHTAYLEINQETHEMTIEQIERELGYKIKIVSEGKGEDSCEDD